MSWNLTKKLDTFAGPSEMKRRDVSWNLTKKFSRHLCGSRRDQEEGGGAGLTKLDFFCFGCFSTADIVFVTLLRTAVETAAA